MSGDDWMNPEFFLRSEAILPVVPFQPEVPDPAQPTFHNNLGTVTIRKRISGIDDHGKRVIAYRDQRSAKIADDGTTLVYFVTPEHYFVYSGVMAFIKNQDDSGKVLAAAEPIGLDWPTLIACDLEN